jgi:hypothetical protein
MSLAGGELDGVRARAIADSPIETCSVARMWMICLLAAWSMTKRSEEGGCTQKTLHAQIVDACYFSNDCQPRDAHTLRFSATMAVRRSGTTKSDIVNEALDRFLDPKDETDQDGELLHRLKGLAKGVRRIHRDVEIVAETLRLHVRQFLMITPPLPKSEQLAAKMLGSERYEVFVKEVAKRIASDSGMVVEIMERIAESNGDRFTRPMGHDDIPANTA